MLAFASTALARVAPVVVKTVTNPVVVRHAVTTAKLAAVSVGLSVLHRQGRDLASQRAAESIAKERDPEAFVNDERRIGGLRDRAKRNVSITAGAVLDEVRGYRTLLVPFYWTTARVAFHVNGRRMTSYIRKHEDELTAPEDAELTKQQQKAMKTLMKRQAHYEGAMSHMARARSWMNFRVLTPGEKYLDEELTTLKHQIVTNEVQTDSVAMIYVRLLEERISFDNFELTDPYINGIQLRELVDHQFEEYEVQTIQEEALHPWLLRHFTLTDRQLRHLTRGWVAGARAKVAGGE